MGGLGFRKMNDQNLAMLTKQAWELTLPPPKPHHHLLKAKYLKHHSFFSHVPRGTVSYFWQGICKAGELMCKGAVYKVGSSRNIDIWKDPWVPNCSRFLPEPKPPDSQEISSHAFTVHQLFSGDTSWNMGSIQQMFNPETVSNILSIQRNHPTTEDKLCWNPNTNGSFTVKYAYLLSRQQKGTYSNIPFQDWNKLWRSKIHERHKLLLWKLIWGILHTSAVLNNRFPLKETNCLLCFQEAETIDHLFLHCPFTTIVWSMLHWPLNFAALSQATVREFIILMLQADIRLITPVIDKHSFLLQVVLTLDYIWQLRNSNRELMIRLDPGDAAKKIDRRLLCYEQAWKIQNSVHSQTNFKAKSFPGLTFSSDVSIKNNVAWISIACTNQYGSLLSAWSYNTAQCATAQGELEGICKTISIAKDLEISSLNLLTNAKNLAEALQSNSFDQLPQLAVLEKPLLLDLSLFSSWSITYVPACNLAKWASSHLGPIPISNLLSSVLLREMKM